MNFTIKQIREEAVGSFSLILEKPKGFTFYPGQYLDIKLEFDDKDKRGKDRNFTIASSPSEDFLMLTTKTGISDFKKTMHRLKTGQVISSAHPAGTFTLDESEPAIFIAGGIGITPFRSMIKYVLDQKLNTQMTLIYSNSDSNFVFKKELARWKKQLLNLRIIYHVSSTKGRLNKQLLEKIVSTFYILPSTFYLAGAPAMVENLTKILGQLGIDETDIRQDSFDGY